MERYIWSGLNNLQVGSYIEYFVKMELTMFGFEVYGTEVDDRGIDFVARHKDGPFLEVQVKSLRSMGYVFMQKEKSRLQPSRYLAFGLLLDRQPPNLFLIPSIVWRKPNTVFVSREYEDLRSKPEWGLNVSKRNMPLLERHCFEKSVKAIVDKNR